MLVILSPSGLCEDSNSCPRSLFRANIGKKREGDFNSRLNHDLQKKAGYGAELIQNPLELNTAPFRPGHRDIKSLGPFDLFYSSALNISG